MAAKREDRYPRLRTNGVAYETTGKWAFDSQVTIEFDYSDLDVKSRDVKKAVSDFSAYVYNLDKKYGIKKASTNISFDVSPSSASSAAASGSGYQGNRTTIGFPLLADGLRIQQVLKDEMGAIGEDGKKIMRGYANRRETGRMNESIRYNTRARDNKYIVNIGWTELWYKYFGFQENGTRTGIRPMHSVIRTYMQMLPKVQNYTSRLYRAYARGDGNFLGGKGPKY